MVLHLFLSRLPDDPLRPLAFNAELCHSHRLLIAAAWAGVDALESTCMGTIFSIEIGTEGRGPERWSVWLPIELAPSYRIKPGSATLGGKSISIESRNGFTVIEVRAFNREDEAIDFLQRLRGAVLLWGIQGKIGLIVPQGVQKLQLFDPPAPGIDNPNFGDMCRHAGWEKVHGSYDVDEPAILPQHKRLTRWVMGRANAYVTTTVEQASAQLLPSIELPKIAVIESTGRLTLAAETYLASLFPISAKARLLELTTVLEILAPTPAIGSTASDALAAALAEAKRSRIALAADRPDHPDLGDLDRLLSRLGQLKRESIKESLRIWTRGVCAGLPGREPDQAAAEIDKHYDVRSKLIHDGAASDADIEAALSWLSDFVPTVLALLIREAAS